MGKTSIQIPSLGMESMQNSAERVKVKVWENEICEFEGGDLWPLPSLPNQMTNLSSLSQNHLTGKSTLTVFCIVMEKTEMETTKDSSLQRNSSQTGEKKNVEKGESLCY